MTVGAAFILTTYAKRWSLEVTFIELKQSLGFEEPQNQAPQAVRRTAPFAALVSALVGLWAARQVVAGHAPCWVPRPWYRHKASLAFPDLLAAPRQASTCPPLSAPPCPPQRPRKSRRRGGAASRRTPDPGRRRLTPPPRRSTVGLPARSLD